MFVFFFFNDTATTEIYTLSLHDALPIYRSPRAGTRVPPGREGARRPGGPRRCDRHLRDQSGAAKRRAGRGARVDRKSTRLNSSHSQISYAVFCLKKKKAS